MLFREETYGFGGTPTVAARLTALGRSCKLNASDIQASALKKTPTPVPPKTYQNISKPQKKKNKKIQPPQPPILHPQPTPLGAQTEAWPSALAASLCASSSFKP